MDCLVTIGTLVYLFKPVIYSNLIFDTFDTRLVSCQRSEPTRKFVSCHDTKRSVRFNGSTRHEFTGSVRVKLLTRNETRILTRTDTCHSLQLMQSVCKNAR